MNQITDAEPEQKAKFMGRITASVTHELQNVLAIIKENSGLMEDLVMMSQKGHLPDLNDKLNACIDKIKKQAYRGVSLTSGLNAFAHTPDQSEAVILLEETVRRLFIISNRIFNLKEVTIQIHPDPEKQSLKTDPVSFQRLVFDCAHGMADFAKHQEILISFHKSQRGPSIDITLPDSNPTPVQSMESSQFFKNRSQWTTKCNLEVTALENPTGLRISTR